MNVNREFIEKWCQALESGEYQQTQGKLHRLAPLNDVPAGYCCVGVACELAGIKSERRGSVVWFEGFDSTAPAALYELTGHVVSFGNLYDRNDGANNYSPHTFPEIAAHLRATYLADTP